MKAVEQSPRHGQWISIPVKLSTGTVKMRTWLVQPLGNDKAAVVVVVQPAPGMDIGEAPKKGAGADWLRAVADQVALQGFIAILPDLSSGLGPNGGDFDSFHFADDVAKALQMRSGADKMEMIRAARDYALEVASSERQERSHRLLQRWRPVVAKHSRHTRRERRRQLLWSAARRRHHGKNTSSGPRLCRR